MDLEGMNEEVLLSVMRAHLRAGNWTEARRIGEHVRLERARESKVNPEGDPRW